MIIRLVIEKQFVHWWFLLLVTTINFFPSTWRMLGRFSLGFGMYSTMTSTDFEFLKKSLMEGSSSSSYEKVCSASVILMIFPYLEIQCSSCFLDTNILELRILAFIGMFSALALSWSNFLILKKLSFFVFGVYFEKVVHPFKPFDYIDVLVKGHMHLARPRSCMGDFFFFNSKGH